MTKTLTRRDFLKLSGSAIGAVALGEFIPPLVAKAARANGQLDASDSGYISKHVRDVRLALWFAGQG
jgi:anaerobic selenocysteine-containing dehydrogenase